MTNTMFNLNQINPITDAESYLAANAEVKANRGSTNGIDRYWSLVSKHLVARCPICNAEYKEAIDTNAITHWLPPSSGKEVFLNQDASYCEHRFLVHRFINLNGIKLELTDPELNGKRKKLVTEVPHVIPQILADDLHCTAVMHSLPICRVEQNQLVPRYILYMLTYFAPVNEHPQLTARIAAFLSNMGEFRSYLIQPFKIKVSDKEAEEQWWNLTRWAENKKLLWLQPDAKDLPLKSIQDETFPYGNIQGRKEPYTISDPPWPGS